MRTTPQWYIDGMNADSRKLICRVYLYDAYLSRIILESNAIADWDVVSELQDAGVPCAYLGQNVATIKIYNEDKKYQTDEFYRNFIKRGTKVKIEIDQSMGVGGLFGYSIFTGWLDNFEYSDDGQFLSITAYDSLHYLKNQPARWFRPSSDALISLYDLLTHIFEMCGLKKITTISDQETHWYVGYDIDSNITVKLRPLFDTNCTVGDLLQTIAQVGVCAIYCDAYDVLTVRLIPRTRHLVYKFDAATQIFNSASSTTGYADYTHIAINVYDTCSKVPYSLKSISDVYAESETIFVKGENSYTDLSLRDSIYPAVIRTVTTTRMDQPNETSKEPAVNHAGPVVIGDTMPMLGSYLYVNYYDYAMDKINISIWAAKGIEAELSILSFDDGRVVGTVAEAQEEEFKESFFLMKKTLSIDCPLMTDKAYAQQCANTYAKVISESAHRITSHVRGQPSLELLDLVAIANNQAVHDSEQVIITRFHYTFDGNLECDIESLSYSTVTLLTYAFISPGFYVPYDAGAVYIIARCSPESAGFIEGAGAYAVGESTRLVVVPKTGWKLDHWEDEAGNNISNGGHLVETVNYSTTYTAVMKEDAAFITFTLDVPEENTLVELPIFSLTPANGTIDWGDGFSEDYDATVEYEHKYEIAGTMEITLRAPIENLAYELFKDNSAINTFTAGSQMAYMPTGMFYNSSVRNVNLLPAQNIIFKNDYTYSESTTSIYNESLSGITQNTYYTTSSMSTDPHTYSNSISINVATTATNVMLPRYLNGMFVSNAAFADANKVVNITTPDTGLLDLYVSNATSLSNINIQGPIANVRLINARNLRSINTPDYMRGVIITNGALTTLNVTSIAPYALSLINCNSLTDIYLGENTTRFDVGPAPTQLINIHEPEVSTEVYNHRGANIVVVAYNSDGGDNSGSD